MASALDKAGCSSARTRRRADTFAASGRQTQHFRRQRAANSGLTTRCQAPLLRLRRCPVCCANGTMEPWTRASTTYLCSFSGRPRPISRATGAALLCWPSRARWGACSLVAFSTCFCGHARTASWGRVDPFLLQPPRHFSASLDLPACPSAWGMRRWLPAQVVDQKDILHSLLEDVALLHGERVVEEHASLHRTASIPLAAL